MTGQSSRNEPISLTAHEVGELSTEQLNELTHPISVTSDGAPVAWLVPLTAGERKLAELVAAGRIRPPQRPGGLAGWKPLPPADGDQKPLSELLLEMRELERT